MSRIHSGRKGQAGSHRPYPAVKPSWVTITRDELVHEAVRLARTGASPAQVGQILRDTHGVPSVRLVAGKRLRPLLREHGVTSELPEDLEALLKRVVHLQRHLEAHPKDLANKRGLSLLESRIRRLARYYRKEKLLPESWRYSSRSVALQVE